MENALLRERINDIAAEVAKLAMQLEGPNSPIEAMLAAEPAPPPKAGRARQWRRAAHRRLRGRRHARRAHPGAAVPRLPRPPARARNCQRAYSARLTLDTVGPALRKSRALTACRSTDAVAGLICRQSRTHSSAGERSLHTGEVQGSIPCASTIFVRADDFGFEFQISGQFRHCERSEAIHLAAQRKNGLLRRSAPRNGDNRAPPHSRGAKRPGDA